jgi:hypothetical protein
MMEYPCRGPRHPHDRRRRCRSHVSLAQDVMSCLVLSVIVCTVVDLHDNVNDDDKKIIVYVDASSSSSSSSSDLSRSTVWYPWGYDPNIRYDEMYYRTSVNVAHGIINNEFDELHVRYHGCV